MQIEINRKRITAVVIVLTFFGATVSRAMGQQSPASKKELPGIIKFDGDMAAFLGEMPRIYDVTIGVEIDPQQPKPQVGFNLREPSLTDVLSAITKSAPRYQWRESGGFVEVFPLEGSSPLLDTTINNFRVIDVDGTEAINQLVNLPEVQASIRALGLKRQDPSNASTGTKGAKFSISLEGVTLRQALNRVANESGSRFWIFRRDISGLISISNSAG